MINEYYLHRKVAEYFDLTEACNKDIPLYKEFIKQGTHCLELGVGTGRVAIELARIGANVTGIDISEAMLAIAQEKLEKEDLEGNVELIQSDMRNFELSRKNFDLSYVADYSFGYLYNIEDQEQCLQSIYKHLQNDGILIIHMFQPNPSYFGNLSVGGVGGSVQEDGGIYRLPNGNQLYVTLSTSYDRSSQRLSANIIYEEISPKGEVWKYLIPTAKHVYYQNEMKLPLNYNGFNVTDIYGDFDRSPLKQDSWEMIFVARKK